jgi:hypothetical protein
MRRSSAVVLQTAIVLLGITVLVFLLGEPLVEGRNAHATLFQVYFDDTFLAWAYLAAVPFFVALYQAFRLVGDAGRSGAFSRGSLRALRAIRYCVFVPIGFILVGVGYLSVVVRGQDDIAGGVAMGVLMSLFLGALAGSAWLLERRLRVRLSQGEASSPVARA